MSANLFPLERRERLREKRNKKVQPVSSNKQRGKVKVVVACNNNNIPCDNKSNRGLKQENFGLSRCVCPFLSLSHFLSLVNHHVSIKANDQGFHNLKRLPRVMSLRN